MKKLIHLLILMFVVTSLMAQPATVWNPAGNDPSDGLWTTDANWTAGIPLAANSKAVFNVTDAMACTVDAFITPFMIVQGDNGPGDTIIVTSSGTLETGGVWSAIGYNNTAVLIVQDGGTFTFGEHAWIGFTPGGVGIIDVYGTLNVTQMTGLGWGGGTGFVTLYDGSVMNCAQFNPLGDNASIKAGSLMDIKGGTLKLTGDKKADIEAYINEGRIVAYGGGATLNVELNGDSTLTTVTSNPDVTAPTVISTSPVEGSDLVAGAAVISFEFSETMDQASVEAAVTFNPDRANKEFSWNGNVISISGDDMDDLQAYTVSIGTAAKDANGVAFAEQFDLNFTIIDPNAPPVIAVTDPADGESVPDIAGEMMITFSKAMDSISTVDSIVAMGVTGFAWDDEKKVLTISYDDLDWETEYTVTVLAGAKAADDTELAEDYSFSFITGVQPLTDIVFTGEGADNLWTNPENWNLEEVADGNYHVVMNDTIAGYGKAVLNEEVEIHHMRLGIAANTTGDTLVIQDGGSLTTDVHWSSIGEDTAATVIVEQGGVLTFGEHMWIGRLAGSDASLHINGGTVNVSQMTGLDWSSHGNKDTVFVNDGGLLDLANIHATQSIGPNSAFVINQGAVRVNGDRKGDLTEYYNLGKILGATAINVMSGKTYVIGAASTGKTIWSPMEGGSNQLTDFRNWSDYNVPNENTATFTDSTTAVYNKNDSIFINKIVCGDGGTGGHIQVDSGKIQTGPTWTGIGWVTPGTLTVNEGASFVFGEHMWIGWTETGVGTVNINGGDVTCSSMFGVGGFETGDAAGSSVTIDGGGTLTLANIHPTQSIWDGSYIDIIDGELIVPLEKRNDTYGYVTNGKLMANGGESFVLFREEGAKVIFYAGDSYDVVFTVTDAVGAVEGAKVSFNSTEVLTDADGMAVFTLTEAITDAAYTITKEDYLSAEGTVTFVASDIMEEVVLEFDPTIGIDEMNTLATEIYPNPVSDVLSIEFESDVDRLDIIDVTGRVVYSISEIKSSKTLQIDVNQFNKGMHLVKIQKGNAISIEKIIIR